MSPVRRLRIRSVAGLRFGRFNDFALDGLGTDFVVVHGRNEAGKSTLAEFLTWSIGGPYGDTANGLRFGDGGETGGGRMLAELDADQLDVEGRFKFRNNGRPKDAREARWQGRTLGAGDIAALLGQLTPDDYHFAYHLMGNTLDEIEQDDGFTDLLARFAVGSIESELNPREAIKSLDLRAKKTNTEIKNLSSHLKALKTAIDSANSRPADLDQMHATSAELASRIEALRDDRQVLVARTEVLARAIGAYRANAAARSAAAVLAATPAPNPSWVQASGNGSEISRLLDERRHLDDEVRDLDDEVVSLTRALGMDRDEIAALNLDDLALSLLREAAREVVDATSAEQSTASALAGASAALTAAKATLEDDARALGKSVDEVASFHGREAALTEAYEVAVQWRSAARARATLEAELETAVEQQTAAISALGTGASPVGERVPSTLAVVALATGAVAAGVVALIEPFLSIAFGVAVGAGLVVVFGRRRAPVDADTTAVEDANARVRDLRTRLDLEHGREGDLERRFAQQAAAFDVGTTNADLGMSLVGQLGKARESWDRMRSLTAEVETAQAAHREAETAVTVRTTTFDRVLESLGLAFASPMASFEPWLGRCISSTQKVAALAAAESRILGITDRITALLGDAAPECADISDDNLREMLERHRASIVDHEAATAALREARIALDAVLAGDEEVSKVLEAGEHESVLSGELDDLQRRTAALADEMDDLAEKRGALGESIRALGDEELLSDLLEERTRVEDQITELQMSKAALEAASAILVGALDDFERTHQTPLISDAVDFLNGAIPEYGSVIYSLGNGDTLLERDANGTRLPVSRLSTGARTALYVALRVALARADGARRGIALPLLCDDPLVHVDDERALALMKMMHETSRERQVIVFSCHERSVAAAESLGATIIRL